MDVALVHDAIELLEKANANLEPELIESSAARELMSAYAKAERVAAFGVAALARKVNDSSEVARMTGTSVGKAKAVAETGRAMASSPELATALQTGAVSLDQANEIAAAEQAAPGSAAELVQAAQSDAFHVLKDKARKAKLEAEQHRGLGERQRRARSGRTWSDELGMTHIHLAFQPHVGAPITARAEAEAARIAKAARAAAAGSARRDRENEKDGGGEIESFDRYLADAYARLLAGSGKGRATRPELVVLVSHEVAKRGWSDVREGEVCKIPGFGPVPPEVAKEIAGDAFLNGVFFDGEDLRGFKRWSRSIPTEVRVALELGEPPGFDGVRCSECGNRFRTEFDHLEPHVAGGPASTGNLDGKCQPCHWAKTERDRRAGKFRPPDRPPPEHPERPPPHQAARSKDRRRQIGAPETKGGASARRM